MLVDFLSSFDTEMFLPQIKHRNDRIRAMNLYFPFNNRERLRLGLMEICISAFKWLQSKSLRGLANTVVLNFRPATTKTTTLRGRISGVPGISIDRGEQRCFELCD